MSKPHFTDGRAAVFGLVGSEAGRKKHVRALRHGLDLLGPTYVCEVCAICSGTTMNPYDRGFGCKYCEGTGLTQGFGCSATFSQRNQVLVAASRSMLLNFEVEIL